MCYFYKNTIIPGNLAQTVVENLHEKMTGIAPKIKIYECNN
jgi:hypothetical protein